MKIWLNFGTCQSKQWVCFYYWIYGLLAKSMQWVFLLQNIWTLGRSFPIQSYLDNSRAPVPLVPLARPVTGEGWWTASMSAGKGRRWSPCSSGPGGRAPPGSAPPPPPLTGVWSSRLGRAGGLVLGASWGGRWRLGTSRRPGTPRTRGGHRRQPEPVRRRRSHR